MTDEEIRKAFEQAFRPHSVPYEIYDHTGLYVPDASEDRWEGWQAAIAWMQSQQEWRAMDSAPRDEREFLLLVRNADPEVFVACWDERAQTWETNDGLIPRRRCWGWLPLPPLPKEKT